jgi:hypothetical protein
MIDISGGCLMDQKFNTKDHRMAVKSLGLPLKQTYENEE